MKIFKIFRWYPVVSIFLFIGTVYILGCITPGYSHTAHTISRLSILKYGRIATINLVQLGVGALMLGIQLAQVIHAKKRYRQILPFFLLAAACLFGVALAPTNYIDRPQELIHLTMSGILHFVAVATFIVLCPVTVFTLVHAFANDPNWKTLTTITIVMALVSVVLSLCWLLFFILDVGWFIPNRGLFQKGIALWTLGWMLLIAVKTARERT